MSVKSQRMSNKTKKKERKKAFIKWIVLTLGYAGFLMWISGMTQVYLPTVVGIGAGQYLDLYIGIVILGTSIYFILSGYLLKNYKE